MRDWLERIAALRRAGERFATATVVGRRAPVSAHLGDRAIVMADGRMDGFIGGACSREIVRKQALDAIRTGRRPQPDAASGIRTAAIMAAAVASARTGVVVGVDLAQY